MSTDPISKKQLQAITELSQRTSSAIEMFRPLPHQDGIFTSPARYMLIQGGNRCAVANTLVWKVDEVKSFRPSKVIPVKLSDISIGDKVSAIDVDGKRKEFRAATVTDKFEFREESFELTTKRGYKLQGVKDHPVFACPPLTRGYHNGVDADRTKAQWVMLKDLPEGWFVKMCFGPYVGWNGQFDEDAYVHGLMDGDGSCDCYDYGVMKLTGHRDEALCGWMSGYLDKRGIKNRLYEKKGTLGVSLEWCNLPFKKNYQQWNPEPTAEVMAGYIRGLMDADGCVSKENKVILIQKDKERATRVHQWLLMFGIKSSLYLIAAKPEQKRPNATYRLVISGMSVARYEDSIGFSEPVKASKLVTAAGNVRSGGDSKQWWDRVASVKSVGEQDIVGISTSLQNYVSNGILSHNSGKSTCAAVLFAAIAIDAQITLSDGTRVDARRPHQKGKCLSLWVVGYDLRHLGDMVYPKLYQKNAFSIIRDKETGRYRTYQEWNPEDKARAEEAQPAPPLIPARFIDPNSWVWEEKKSRQFKRVTIWDPVTHEPIAVIHAFSSRSEASQGTNADCVYCDESLESGETHLTEYFARIAQTFGRFFWASWPSHDDPSLVKFAEDCDKAKEEGSTLFERFILRTSQNKTLDPKAVEELRAALTPEEALARDLGEFNTANFRFYPLFDKKVHSAITGPGIKEDRLSEILRETDGVPPSNWCRILSLDPGTQHPAVLFCAVPPPDLGDYWVVFDELYPGRADAIQLAEMIMRRTRGDVFNKFVIDWRAGRQTSMGASQTNAELYAKAFHQHRLKSELTGSGFQNGCDNPGYRAGLVRSALHTNSHGFPKLRIVTHKCPKLVRQMETVMKKRIKQIVDEERKSDSMPYDLTDALEYFAACSPIFMEPRDSRLVGESSALKLLRLLQSKAKKDKTESAQLGPTY